MNPSTPAAQLPLYLFLVFLVPLLPAGLALMNTGLGRTRSAAHFMLSSLVTIALAACVYVLCGFSWEGFPGQAAHSFLLKGKPWNWIAGEPFLLHGVRFSGSPATASVFLQIFTVGLTAMIPLAAGADRWRLNASLISTALLAGWTYPLFAHWVWGGGWLSQLGYNYGLGAGFLDAGGTSTIHVVGGLSALAIVWILGPRLGKYSEHGVSAAIPGHNIVYVLFGCALMLPGWMALNAAGALLFAGASPHFSLWLESIRCLRLPPPAWAHGQPPAFASPSRMPRCARTAGPQDWWPAAPPAPSSVRLAPSSPAWWQGLSYRSRSNFWKYACRSTIRAERFRFMPSRVFGACWRPASWPIFRHIPRDNCLPRWWELPRCLALSYRCPTRSIGLSTGSIRSGSINMANG